METAFGESLLEVGSLLQIIFGRAGAGKTYEARRIAIERAQQGKQAVLIVPEQYSFQSERAILLALGTAKARNVEVSSFTRLAEKQSEKGSARIDDCGKAAVMYAALSNIEDYLELYSRKRKNIDFVTHLLNAVKELKLFAVEPTELEKTARKAPTRLLSMKLSELALVCAEYDRIVAQAGFDDLDMLTRYAQKIEDTRWYAGKTVIIDCFRGFTGQELKVISAIMAQAEECVITLCADSLSDPEKGMGLFSPVKKTAQKLIDLAKRRGVAVKVPIVLERGKRFKNDALSKIESGIFNFRESPTAEETDAVHIYEALDHRDEADFTFREIRRLLREENYRCRDIVVLVRDEGKYMRYVREAAAEQNVPLFFDRRVSIEYSPAVRFVSCALTLCRGRWQSENILTLLKTEMIDGITKEDIALCEEYSFMWDINGEKWKSEFTSNPDGLEGQITEEGAERLEKINSVRKRLCALLIPFCEKMKEASGRARAQYIYELLDCAGTAGCIIKMCESLTAQDSQVQQQVWDVLMGILDKTANIEGEKKLPLDEFTDMMSLMISSVTVGQIPQGLDEVTFGAADRVRTSEPRATFILGAYQGGFPAEVRSSGVFTDVERKQLIDMGLDVAEPSSVQALDERLLCYNAMCGASERLYITTPRSVANAKASPSELISEAKRLLPNCKKTEYSDCLTMEQIEGIGAAFSLCAASGEKTPLGASLKEAISKRDEYADKLRTLERAKDGRHFNIRNKDTSYALFGKDIKMSQSRADDYFKCPFKFFCDYGLNVKPRRKAKIDAMSYGTVVHYILEHITKQHTEDMTEFSQSDKLRPEIDRLLDSYLEENMGGKADKSPRFLHLLISLADSVEQIIKFMGAEFEVGSFRPIPDAMELFVGSAEIPYPKINLKNGTLRVSGLIDRVDEAQVGLDKYLRIIDYKTGKKNFSADKVVQGLDMQMFMYFDALLSSGRFGSYKPAGALYFPASFSLKDAKRQGENEQAQRADQLKMSGQLIEDMDVLSAMEEGIRGCFVPAKVTSKGNIDKRASHTMTYEEFYGLCRYTRKLLAQMGEALHEGEVAPKPVYGKAEACSYCDMKNACGVEDPRTAGREIEKYSDDRLRAILLGEGESNNG